MELNLQVGSEYQLGYEGVAMLELIGHMAYNSAYNQLRTKEQLGKNDNELSCVKRFINHTFYLTACVILTIVLFTLTIINNNKLGYIVSAYMRKTAGGTVSFTVLVQSSQALPSVLEERCEAWLKQFRQELEEMSTDTIANEAAAVVAQYLERNMRFADEVSSASSSILAASMLGENYDKPVFDRREKLAKMLICKENESMVKDYAAVNGVIDDTDSTTTALKSVEDIKRQMLEMWDKYFLVDAKDRRSCAVHVYGHKGKDEYEKNLNQPGVLSSYEDARQVKQFFGAYPNAPFWVQGKKAT